MTNRIGGIHRKPADWQGVCSYPFCGQPTTHLDNRKPTITYELCSDHAYEELEAERRMDWETQSEA